MQINMQYSDWRKAVDGRLQQIYCITIDDIGFNEEYLIDCWESQEMPFDLVEWFGKKFDLDPMPSHAPSAKRGN
jgi:hypothetical protein